MSVFWGQSLGSIAISVVLIIIGAIILGIVFKTVIFIVNYCYDHWSQAERDVERGVHDTHELRPEGHSAAAGR